MNIFYRNEKDPGIVSVINFYSKSISKLATYKMNLINDTKEPLFCDLSFPYESQVLANKIGTVNSFDFDNFSLFDYSLVRADSENDEEILKQQKILDSYYKGDYSFLNVTRAYSSESGESKNYNFLDNAILRRENKKYKQLNILNLPEKLFILQLLESGRFSRLHDIDYSEQLALFDYRKICGFSYEEFIATRNPDNYSVQELKDTSEIISRIRK